MAFTAFRELASGDHKQTYTFFLKREWGGLLIIVNALCKKKLSVIVKLFDGKHFVENIDLM
jgi:hypothetical protein